MAENDPITENEENPAPSGSTEAPPPSPKPHGTSGPTGDPGP